MKRFKTKKMLSILLGSTLALSVLLSACNTGGTTTSTSESASTVDAGSQTTAEEGSTEGSEENTSEASEVQTGDRPSITWMSVLHTDTPPSPEMVEALGDFTGVNLTFEWVPAATVDERMNTALASNKLADIVTMNRLRNATQRAALQAGIFWDVEEYISDYENLSDISEERINTIRVDGKLYGVPVVKPVARYGVVVRQDWLDNLGLEAPNTMEELVEVALAFTNDDPDGDGQANTTGLIERNEAWGVSFRQIAGWYGAPNHWGVTEEGNVEPWFLHDGYFDALETYKGLYDQKAINDDFAVREKGDQRSGVAQGQGGLVITGLYDARNYYNDAVDLGMEGDMTWALVNDMSSEGVERRILSDTNNGVGGLYALPKSEVENEEEVKTILSFINDLASMEGFKLMTNGIEGVHYEEKDGLVETIDESKWKSEVQALSGSRINELLTYEFKVANPMMQASNDAIVANEPYAIYDISPSLESETYNTQWSQLENLPKDAFYKYVMGDISLDEVHAAHEAWKSQGGQAMIDEFTASYKSIYE